MLTDEAKRKLTAGGMFGLPIVLVWVTAQMLGGPKSAEAGETPVPVPAVLANENTTPTIEPGDAALAAQARVFELKELEFGPTPLFHAAPGVRIEINTDPEQQPPPQFNVKAIMASRAGNTALIDGAAMRVGERLGDTNWRIAEIDAVARSVTIEEIGSDRTSTSYVKTGSIRRQSD